MGLLLNGKKIASMTFNGRKVKEVWLNGQKVWPEYTFQLGSWQHYGTAELKYACAFASVYNVLYFCGGQNSGSVLSSFYMYSFPQGGDTTSPIMTNLGTLTDLKRTEAVMVNTTNIFMYLFGGKPDTSGLSNEISKINRWQSNTNTVTAMEAETYPAQGMAAAVPKVQDNPEIFTGYHSGFLNNHVMYNWSADTITTKTEYPDSANGIQAIGNGSKGIYFIGGNTSSGRISTVRFYNVDTDTYSLKSPLPVATAFGRAVKSWDSTKILYMGGENSSTTTSSMYEYDIVGDKWYTQTNLLQNISKQTVHISQNGNIFSFSGRTSSGTSSNFAIKFIA